jgi:hypothetical protein
MTKSTRSPLLSYVARWGLFAQNGEPAATACLALLLQTEERLSRATVDWLTSQTGVALGAVTWFEGQAVHRDRRRPDLEGWDAQKRPLVVIEAKMSHDLTEDQFAAYLRNQRSKLEGDPGALVALVPASRAAYAEEILARAKASTEAHEIATAVVTWDAWLDCWDDAIAADGSADFGVRSDLYQLRGLVQALDGMLVRARVPDPDADWRTGLPQMKKLVDKVTRTVNADLGISARDLSAVTKDPLFPGRYVRVVGQRTGANVDLWVGLSMVRADVGQAPIWAILSRDRAAPVIGALLQAFPQGEEDERGSFWIALELPDLAGPELVHFTTDRLRALREQLAALL